MYNDRINTHRKMVSIDKEIDTKATPDMVRELAELRIRNLMCFHELEAYNNTGKFLLKHPLLAFKSEREELENLFKYNFSAFLDSYANARENVKRYRTHLKNKKYTESQQEKHKERLAEHTRRLELMQNINDNKPLTHGN